jgi:hypothetical protein
MTASETRPRRQTGRSVLAVVLGILAGLIPTIATDAALHATGVFPALGQTMSDGLCVLATAYRLVFAMFGSYIIARLAPDRPMWHALVGGVVGVIASTVGAVATWNHVPSLGPHWYPVALSVTSLPCAWLGGKLRLMQLPTSPAA